MKFVRKYNLYGIEYYEVIYKSGRIVTYSRERLPKTVKAFLAGKQGREQFDRVFNRTETIYEKDSRAYTWMKSLPLQPRQR